MRFRIRNELLILDLLVVLLVLAIVFFPSNAIRIILGIPFLLFFPGYTLTAILFPEKGRMDSIERVGVSIGMSITAVALILLILNYSPWGVRLESALYAIASFILITSIIAWLRRRHLREEERFSIELHPAVPGWGKVPLDRVLSIVLVVVMLGVLGTLVYAIGKPRVVGERFTDFYIVGLEGQAIDYPKGLKVGEQGSVVVGIINQEQEVVTYRIEMLINGVRNSEIGPVTLENDEKWEEVVDFTPQKAGNNQKVEFWLYKEGQNEVYHKLHIWVDVTE